MLSKIKKNFFILISTFFFLYFFFNLFDGERGLISYFEKRKILEKLKIQKIELNDKINNLEIKNSLLTNNLDLDYIETLLRQKFLLVNKDEKFYTIEKHDN